MSLSDERESLLREIAELQTAKNVFLEETTMLNVRNEELAHLNAHYTRRIELAASSESLMPSRETQSFERQRSVQPLQPSHTVNASIGLSSDESADSTRFAKSHQKTPTGDAHLRVFKWRGNHKEATAAASAALDGPNEKTRLKHAFQIISVLRLSKCDHCGEKLWGSQARCQSMYCRHFRSVVFKARSPSSLPYLGAYPLPTKRSHLFAAELFSSGRGTHTWTFAYVCLPFGSPMSDLNFLPPEPVMFGRELTEQVRADSKYSDRMVPLIVEKCIAAVDDSGELPLSKWSVIDLITDYA